MKIKVFLDTNIVLSSISLKSSAYLLQYITNDNDFDFYISKIVEEEIEKKTRESKKDRAEKHNMLLQIKNFLNALNISVLDDSHHIRNFNNLQENDEIICKIACEQHMDFICTYNQKDFVACTVDAISPLGLLKSSSFDPHTMFQFYFNLIDVLKNNFALYIGFDFQGIVQDLVLLQSIKSGYQLVLTTQYKLKLLKNTSLVKEYKKPLKSNTSIKLYIVVYDKKIHIYNLEENIDPIIVNAISEIEISTKDILPMNANGNFYGHIREVSMYSLQDTQKLMKHTTLKNIKVLDSIEYLWGNISI